jgi:hypothetical protein
MIGTVPALAGRILAIDRKTATAGEAKLPARFSRSALSAASETFAATFY